MGREFAVSANSRVWFSRLRGETIPIEKRTYLSPRSGTVLVAECRLRTERYDGSCLSAKPDRISPAIRTELPGPGSEEELHVPQPAPLPPKRCRSAGLRYVRFSIVSSRRGASKTRRENLRRRQILCPCGGRGTLRHSGDVRRGHILRKS